MEQMEQAEQKTHNGLKPWHGILAFAVMMVLFRILGYPIQAKLGLIGVAITELMLLAMAIVAALVFRQKLREVFPMKLPKLREVFGVLVFWMGGFVVSIMVSSCQTMLFPEEMAAMSGGLSSVVSSKGMLLGILIVSFMPAICEEAVHRGFILHTFKDVKKPWVVVLSMGIIFGVFHMDLYRFLPTAILGACMTWVMLKTDNMLMPALFHGTNNLVPVLISFALQGIAEAMMSTVSDQAAASVATLTEMSTAMTISIIGSYLTMAVTAAPLMLAGTALMKKKGEKISGKHVATIFIIAGVLFFIGLAMLIGGSVYMVMEQGIGM